MIPVLYPRDIDVSTLSQNTSVGLGALVDTNSAVVLEERNGEFELEIEYPQNGARFDEITTGSYIKAKPAVGGKDQFFRVYRISEPIDGMCTINAEHVSYLLNGYVCEPFLMTRHSAGEIQPIQVLDGLKDHVVGKYSPPFTFVSTNLTQIDKFELSYPENFRAMLGGVSGSVLDVYGGGEYEWDNEIVKFHSHRGADRGVTVAYGKNLTDLKLDMSDDNIVTGVYAYWKKESEETDPETGETVKIDLYYDRATDATGASAVIYNEDAERYLNGTRVVTIDLSQEEQYSENPPKTPVTNGYVYRGVYSNTNVYSRGEVVEYNCRFYAALWDNLTGHSPEEEQYWMYMQDDYRKAAEKFFKTHNAAEPETNLEVSFIDLAGTEEYKDIMPLEQVHLCDIVHVEYPDYGISVALKVVKTEFDVVGERYNKVTLGNSRTDLSKQFQSAETFEDEMRRTVPTRYNVNDGLNHLMELIGMVGGGYKTVDGGWTYYHDRPVLAQSVRVIKVGASGIFFSENGVSGTFNSGWGVDGQAVFQMATAWRLNAERIETGFISADGTKNGNYWDLDSGEFCLKAMTQDSTAATKEYASGVASQAASGAVSSYDAALNQQAVFNKLTDNLQNQGIYLDGRYLYINASMINAGSIATRFLSVNGIPLAGLDISSSIIVNTPKVQNVEVRRFPYMVYVRFLLANPSGAETIVPGVVLASGFPAVAGTNTYVDIVGIRTGLNSQEDNDCLRVARITGGDMGLTTVSRNIGDGKTYEFSGWYFCS